MDVVRAERPRVREEPSFRTWVSSPWLIIHSLAFPRQAFFSARTRPRRHHSGTVNSARPRRAATPAVEYQSFPAVDGQQVDAGESVPLTASQLLLVEVENLLLQVVVAGGSDPGGQGRLEAGRVESGEVVVEFAVAGCAVAATPRSRGLWNPRVGVRWL